MSLFLWHITLQVTDVLAVAIKECESFQQPTKCGGMRRGSPEGRPSRMEPEGADSARSSYRLLGEVNPFILFFPSLFLLYFPPRNL